MSKHALIVGGGIGGMCCAIGLRRIGWTVDLIDIDPNWRALGAGMTLSGATLRAFRSLGVVDEIYAKGAFPRSETLVRRDGTVEVIRPLPPEFEPGLPVMGGILRPVLHKLLADHVLGDGVQVRLGVSVSKLEDDGRRVRANFTDGEAADYDLVVGADSLKSVVRNIVFPEVPQPRFVGQACWRMVVPRPAGVEGTVRYVDDPYPFGFNPVSADKMYMFLLTPEPTKRFVPDAELLGMLRDLLAIYGGMAREVREQMDETYLANYRPLETVFVEGAWHRGRVILIGDAAHSTTPHLGFGAGLAVEDAVVLAEELDGADHLEGAFERFMARRLDRARYVVDTSVRMSALKVAGKFEERIAQVMASHPRVMEPI